MVYIEHDFPVERLNPIAQREGNAKKPIYQIHKWWARRLGSVFRMLILAAFAEDDITEEELWRRFYSNNYARNREGKPPVILDPFMGGGTTVVEALRLGCKVIGMDLNPVAWFVTKKEIEPVNLEKLDEAFKHLEDTVAPEIKRYYRTTCSRGHACDVMYVFWVKKVPCLACGKEVKFFPSFRIATKKGYHVVFCPHCYHIINGDLHTASAGERRQIDLDTEVLCPDCGTSFVPSTGFSGRGKYTCPSCGQKDNVLNAVRTSDGPVSAEMFAVEYYCDMCGRGYKRAGDWDLELFENAKQEFARRKENLLFPRQAVPDGLKTRELLNHGYKYFYQMFNERQLLCLSVLLQKILGIEDENVREAMIITLSDCVNAQNLFCKYNAQAHKLEPLFGLHAFHPIDMPVENNVWGTELGRGSFLKYYNKTLRAKKDYPTCNNIGDGVEAVIGDEVPNILDGQIDSILRAQTAEDLSFLPSKSVDAIVTDPPYCDNVMYSELSDFFYVWLHLALKEYYSEFRSELTPRTREIVKNDAAGKDEAFFFRGLTCAFKESQRVLKDHGLFLFTFHHKEPWAWKSVLKAILNAGFYVTAAYPVRSEGTTGVHGGVGKIRYDIPFICRKRLAESRRVAWEDLKDEIYFKAQESAARIKTDPRRSIADVDLFVIVMGRCLELYSKHWPKVMKDGEKVDVDQAVDDIRADFFSQGKTLHRPGGRE